MRSLEPTAGWMATSCVASVASRRGGAQPITLRSRLRAFTLIEVLAALIIVSLGMLGVIQAVGQTASNTSYLREKTLAHWVAMNRLTEARLQPNAPKVDKTSDEVEMAGYRWRWTMEVTQTAVENIRRIDISVRVADANADSSLASVSGFYGMAIAPAGTTLISWRGMSEPGAGGGGESGDQQSTQQESTQGEGTPRNRRSREPGQPVIQTESAPE